MNITELVVGVAILAGVVGIVVPVLPGSLLILGAVLVWATEDGSRTAWIVFSVVALLLITGAIVKYAVPGRSLKATGVPNRSLLAGGLLGIIGFFVLPVIGLFVGFVLGVYASERQRVGSGAAWPSTKAALRAVGASVLIELVTGLLAATAWLSGAILT
ncbi:MAG: DUF456 domain-containing protein [Actinomycetota bacterium]|nr:DUF456 domain-containing protein [Actinomycetota bacterium]